MELRALVSQTREAIESGRYGVAVAACEHMLATFPAALGARRMLGEALVEQGAFDKAEQHFTRVLSIDPLDTVAHLGLGVIAEERNDPEGAYTHYLKAWETHPELDHLRDELVRLRAASDEDATLEPTRPALAAFYTRGGQIRRALAEWRSIIADEPENMAARLALAQMLWLSGDDSGAMVASREVLGQLPDCARAMAIVADIERRERGDVAADRIDHYRSLDPSGEIASELGSVASDRDLGFLVDDTVEMPDFKAADEPAPVDTTVPIGAGREAVSGTHAAEADPWAGLMREMSQDTDGSQEGGATPAVPFSWDGIGVGDSGSDPLAAEVEAARPAGVGSNAQSGGEDLGQLSDVEVVDPSIQPFSFEDEGGNTATGVRSTGGDDWLTSEDVVVPAEAPDEAVKPAAAEQVPTAGAGIDLTAGWDDLDRALKEAVPSDVSLQGYEGLIESFQAEGITPIDPGALGSGDEWKPLSAEEWEVDDDSPEPVAAGPSSEGVEQAATNAELDEFAVLDRLAQDSSFEQDVSGSAEIAGENLGLSEEDLALDTTRGGTDDALDAAQQEFAAGGYTAILQSLDSEQPSADDAERAGGPEASGSEPPAAGDDRGFDEAAVGQTDLMIPAGDRAGSGFDDLKAGLNTALSSLAGSEDFPLSETPSGEQDYTVHERELEPIEPDTASQELAATADALAREQVARGERERSPWPQFVAGTIRLGAAADPGFPLFAQMREEKASLVELGILTVDRSLAWAEPKAVSDAAQADEVVTTRADEGASGSPSLDRERLRMLRSRLSGDVPTVEETARELEQMAASGHGAMVSRLLGEAYLRLRRPGEAAEVFRRAIVERGHFR